MPGIITVVGKPGCGKSTLIAADLVRSNAHGNPLVLFDPSGDLSRYMQEQGLDMGRFRVAPTEAPEKFARDWLSAGSAQVIVFAARDPKTILAMARAWLEVASEMRRGYIYACDEAELLFPNAPLGEQGHGAQRAGLLTLARNRQCRLIVGSKRPQKIHVDARENAAHVCIFRSDSAAFLRACENFGDTLDYEERVPHLARGQYLYRGPFDDELVELHDTSEPPPWDLLPSP
jgi:hypothetical protein